MEGDSDNEQWEEECETFCGWVHIRELETFLGYWTV